MKKININGENENQCIIIVFFVTPWLSTDLWKTIPANIPERTAYSIVFMPDFVDADKVSDTAYFHC